MEEKGRMILNRMGKTLTGGRTRLSPLWGAATVALLTLVGSIPFFQPSLTRSDDSSYHLYRLLELHHLLAQGTLFSRWLPDLAQGYGFPLFNFYPPLAYYVAEVPHLLGLSLTRSLNLTYILGAMLAAVSMYLLVLDLSTEAGAALAALVYAYAPSLLYNAIYRGGVSEVLAWAMAPLILWCFRRLVLTGRARWFLAASLSYAALLLTHYLSALPFTPLLALFILGVWNLGRPDRAEQAKIQSQTVRPFWRWWTNCAGRGLLLALAAGLLGMGISAFITVPALLEKGFVHIEMVFLPPGLDFHNHFVSWQDLLAGPHAVDTAVAARSFPHAIGLIQVGAGLVGLLAALTVRRPARERVLYLIMAASALALVFMTGRASLGLWEGISFLKFIQFPWRLLAPLCMVLAWLAGGIGLLLPRGRRWAWVGPALAAAMALGLFLYNTPLLYPRYVHERPANPTLSDMLVEERKTGLLGTTTMGDYLPIWAGEMPWNSPLPAQYAAGGPVTWLDHSALPAGVRVNGEHYGVNDMELSLAGDAPFPVVIQQYYFPGWRAEIDGRPAPIAPQERTGLITVAMPAGAHTLRVYFGETPLRATSDGLSLLSLAGLAVLTWWVARRPGTDTIGEKWPGMDTWPATGQGACPAWGWLCLLAVMAAYLGLKAGVIDRRDNVLRTSSIHGDVVTGSQPLQVSFGGKLRLLGYKLQTMEVPAGEKASFSLYWRLLQPPDRNYSVSVQLIDSQGRTWAKQDNWQPSGLPTSQWATDEYRTDGHALTVPPGTPPGEYRLQLTVYDTQTLQPLSPDPGGGLRFTLPGVTVKVVRPAQPPDPASLGLARIIGRRLNDDMELLGASIGPGSYRPGQRVHLDLFWRAVRRPGANYRAQALLVGPDGTVLVRDLGPLAGAGYPTTAWQAGEIIRGQYDLLLPAETPAGTNVLKISLAAPGQPAAEVVGEVPVEAVERHMEAPSLQHPVGAVFGDCIALLGYDLDAQSAAPGATLHLRLYWQGRQSMEQEYTVFTHLLDAEDHVVAQQDSAPAQGMRPTTGWLPGEVISDEYTLTLPPDAAPGEYRIEVGLYEPGSGERLTASDAAGQVMGDHLILGSVTVR